MLSPSKLAANRRNAMQSTGPRSDAGKAIASRNAVKHGLLSNKPLIPGEKEEDFTAFTEGWLDDLQPLGAREGYLAGQIVSMNWRKLRLAKIESEFYENELKDMQERRPDREPTLGRVFDRDATGGNVLSKLHRYDSFLDRSIARNLKELDRLKALRGAPAAGEEEVRNEPTAAQPDPGPELQNEPTEPTEPTAPTGDRPEPGLEGASGKTDKSPGPISI